MFYLKHAGSLETFKVNDRVFGYIDNDDRLLGSHRRPIGRIQYQIALTPIGPNLYTALVLNGQRIAELNYFSDVGDRIWKAPNLVRDLLSSFTEDQALWVMAAIGQRLYAHCRTLRMT
jgi:hypothetical protein